VTWEHPADRAALQSLRSVPGFDEVVKKIYGFIGERGVRLIFQADAVRVGPTQFPRLNQLYTDILTSMDWPERPELFVSQTPFANAGAFGMDRPFIVINSGTLKLLDDDEVRNVLGHELGHVMSGHALYHTILVLILHVGLGALPFLAGIAILPIQLALLEWFRKSELSSDRAGLLACQDPTASLRVNLKFAGGGDMSQMDLNAFLVQAKEYETRAARSTASSRSSAYWAGRIRSTRCEPPSCSAGSKGGTTIACCAANTPAAGPRRSSVPSTRTSTTPATTT